MKPHLAKVVVGAREPNERQQEEGNDYEDNRRFRSELDRARQRPEGQPIQRQPVAWHIALLRKHSYLYGLWWVRQRAAAMANPQSPERGRWRSELDPAEQAAIAREMQRVPILRRLYLDEHSPDYVYGLAQGSAES